MTPMPVVVGVDGSLESLRAVEWAASEAGRHGVPLRIVSALALPPRMDPDRGATQTVANVVRDEYASALSEALARAREVAPGLLADADLLSGAPAEAVTQSGAGALMLVVGARGMGGFAAMLLGSVCRYVAAHATCPVVVVRGQTSTAHREVAVGVGDRHDAARTLAFAFDEAARRQVAILVVHPAAVAEKLARSLADWQEKYPDVPVRQEVVRGHPARILASYSATADLVVIGRYGTHHHVNVRGIQHAVLSHAHGPVAVVSSGE